MLVNATFSRENTTHRGRDLRPYRRRSGSTPSSIRSLGETCSGKGLPRLYDVPHVVLFAGGGLDDGVVGRCGLNDGTERLGKEYLADVREIVGGVEGPLCHLTQSPVPRTVSPFSNSRKVARPLQSFCAFTSIPRSRLSSFSCVAPRVLLRYISALCSAHSEHLSSERCVRCAKVSRVRIERSTVS